MEIVYAVDHQLIANQFVYLHQIIWLNDMIQKFQIIMEEQKST